MFKISNLWRKKPTPELIPVHDTHVIYYDPAGDCTICAVCGIMIDGDVIGQVPGTITSIFGAYPFAIEKDVCPNAIAGQLTIKMGRR